LGLIWLLSLVLLAAAEAAAAWVGTGSVRWTRRAPPAVCGRLARARLCEHSDALRERPGDRPEIGAVLELGRVRGVSAWVRTGLAVGHGRAGVR